MYLKKNRGAVKNRSINLFTEKTLCCIWVSWEYLLGDKSSTRKQMPSPTWSTESWLRMLYDIKRINRFTSNETSLAKLKVSVSRFLEEYKRAFWVKHCCLRKCHLKRFHWIVNQKKTLFRTGNSFFCLKSYFSMDELRYLRHHQPPPKFYAYLRFIKNKACKFASVY